MAQGRTAQTGSAERSLRAVAGVPLRAAPPPPAWRIDPQQAPPDPDLLRRVGAAACIAMGVLPWRRMGGAVTVLAPSPEILAAHGPGLTAALGPVRLALCDAATIRSAIVAAAAPELVLTAETRVAAADSCRDFDGRRGTMLLTAGAVLLLAGALAAPAAVVGLLAGWAILTLAGVLVFRLAALTIALRGTAEADRIPGDPVPARLPVVSLLVPLFREREVARHLVASLGAIDYPPDRLDICLIVEEDDSLTQAALVGVSLPPGAQVIAVPRGTIRTKPRALNYALPFTRGTIIGIYDAEDRPAADQIHRVVRHFARRGPDVACLQGILDYYNPAANWLARCFTLEYGGWFRVILPAVARLGLPVPLGGTTLFLRRHALESVGGWDAHNVTEDADLGVRLARYGYRTEVIATVTGEEANARAWPWVKQRTRWLKGYLVTWVVHMRAPRRLWRELGPRGFVGFQVLFLFGLSQFLLAPVLWSLWALPLGLPHPLSGVLAGRIGLAVAVLLLLSEIAGLCVFALGASRAGKRWLIGWVLTLPLYFPLATIAAWRALLQMMRSPFLWEKTAHGVWSAPVSPPSGPLSRRP